MLCHRFHIECHLHTDFTWSVHFNECRLHVPLAITDCAAEGKVRTRETTGAWRMIDFFPSNKSHGMNLPPDLAHLSQQFTCRCRILEQPYLSGIVISGTQINTLKTRLNHKNIKVRSPRSKDQEPRLARGTLGVSTNSASPEPVLGRSAS